MRDAHGFWHQRRVFITGCTGLVGSWTVRALVARGAHVVGLVRDQVAGSELARSGMLDRIDVVRGDVTRYELMERALAEYEIQTVIHLAAQTIVGIANRCPLSTFDTNIKGTWSILEAARRCGTSPHVIVASSDKAYGDQDVLPYTETAPLQGLHPYDASKSCADLIALTYTNTYGLPVCVTRCGNFFGGGDMNWNRIVPGTIRSVLRRERPVIRSDGTNIRDYFYVKDGAEAYLHLAECMSRQPEIHGHAFNLSTESQVSVLEMVERILRLMETELTPQICNEAHHEIRHQYLSSAKARAMLAWSPRYALDEALSETIGWYRDFFTASGASESTSALRVA
jgi:CDP-glucose 4,6-dehydratase